MHQYQLPVLVLLLLLATTVHCDALRNTTKFFNDRLPAPLTYETYSGYEDIDWYYSKGIAGMYYSIWQGYSLPWSDHSVPVIFWLQGGPGASSQFGCFNEVGPISIVNKDGTFKVVENSWGWNFNAHLVCVDQPLGVGFSYNKGPKVTNSSMAAKHFINFLSNFMKNSPWKLGNNPIYLAGSGYAGHYIPPIAEAIMTNSTLGANLKGIMMGNAFVDPYFQVNNFDSMLTSAGIITRAWRSMTADVQNEALTNILNEKIDKVCTVYQLVGQKMSDAHYNGVKVNNFLQYKDEKINPDYGKFLNMNKKQFGVPDDVNFVDTNEALANDFCRDFSISYRPNLERVLNLGLRTLIYHGQLDLTIPISGVLTYLNSLVWIGSRDWKAQKKQIWEQSYIAIRGWIKSKSNLTFVMIRNAGHFVPADKPDIAYLMVSNFINNQW